MSAVDDPLYVDPDTDLILKELAAAGAPDRSSLSVAEARRLMEEVSRVWNRPLPPVHAVVDFEIPGKAAAVPVRLIMPLDRPALPVVVFLHGGGFVLGSLDSHHRFMRLLAIGTGAAVLGVGYRLAPEAPFPAALEDTQAALRWAGSDAARARGLDPDRIIVAGDSAGANLALASLIALRDDGAPLPHGGALFYGCYWSRLDTPSHRMYGNGGYRLSSSEMAWFWSQYLPAATTRNPLAEPLYANLVGLPPLFLNCGTVDPLADDTAELRRRLFEAGVVHEIRTYPGLIHGFLQMTNRVQAAARAMEDACRSLSAMINPGAKAALLV